MTDDDIGAVLAALDRPLAPPEEVAEQMWARAAAALRAPALDAAGEPHPPSPGGEMVDPVELVPEPAHEPRRRLQSPRIRLLAAAAVVVVAALVAGLLSVLEREEDRVTAAGSGAPFRARVQTSQMSSSGPEPQPTPVPSDRVVAPVSEQIISHGGDGRWRMEWVTAPAGVGGPGSYEVWDRDRKLIYRADTNTYRIEDAGDYVNTSLVSYVDLDEVAADCDRVERVDSGGTVANRATRLLRCFRDATETQPATGEDLWVDAVTGLFLRRETSARGEVLGRSEVLEVEYSPDFEPDTFSTTPPAGARKARDPSPLGSVLVKGREAPAWKAPRLGGGQISTSELRGRPAVYLLWSSWCEPCVGDTLLAFDRMASAWSGRISLVAVAVNDDEADVAAKVSELGMTVPVALDPKGDRVIKPWDLGGVPDYVFLDGSGVVAAVRLSPLAPEELAAALDDLAAGRPLDVPAEPPPPPPCRQPVEVEAGPGAPGVSGRVYFGVVYAKGAYGSCTVPTGPYVIAPDGSDLRRVSDDDGFLGVAVSPTGELVREIWATGPERRGAGESHELWLVRPSLQHSTKLVDRGSDPVWSHDGQRIAFVRKDATGTVVAVAVVNRDGTGERTVSTDQNLRSITSRLAWEPGDGALIADLASAGGDASSIVRYPLDGSPPTSLLLEASTPAVSSRDATLAVIHSDPHGADHGRIELARPDGKGRRFLTPPRSAAVPAFYELDFSPDGAWIVASGAPDAADPYPRRRIYLVEVATGAITELASLGVRPSW